jgi:hypothetical protein
VIFMGIKDQVKTLKNNWLIIALFLVGLFAMTGMGNGIMSGVMYDSFDRGYGGDMMMAESTSYKSGRGYMPSPSYGDDFAPEVEERVIVKNSYLNSEVEQGTFYENEQRLKDIIQTSDAFLLNENVNEYETNWNSYFSGSYSIKVPAGKYDAVLSQLREIGELQSFSDNSQDITGSYTNQNIEVEMERARLQRFLEMYEGAELMEDKILLNDRIFDQERRVKYLDDAIQNMDTRVDYSQVSFSMSEKRSEYVDVTLVRFSNLVESLVNSLNSLLQLLFMVLPWALVFVGYKVVRKVIKKKKK